jgi:hypothetical protein
VSRDVHLPGPPADLLSAASDVAFVWLVRITKQAFGNANCSWESAADEIDAMAVVESERLIEELAGLMSTDVDEQRTNPLSVFRNAVAGPTGLLGRCGIAEPDSGASGQFPADPYGLWPATWSDIDPSLHDPGIAWGAWKAMTVLRRRRDEGQR